jgi:probable O-glycosylation ligase (exosortase A-associated)
MRDLIILAVFGAGLLYALRDPFVGLLVYTWISVMSPHRYAWGMAYDMPLALAAAGVTVVSMALHSESIRFPRNREAILFLLFWGWVTLTTQFAMYPAAAWVKWGVVTKIFVMILVSMLLVTNRRQLFQFVTALIVCVGFLGVKGAVFGLKSGGTQKVWGPPQSFLEDNNASALAMVMIIPFCFFLREIAPKKWQSHALLVIGGSLVVSAVLTYSRGGLLGLLTVAFATVVYSRHKFRNGALAVLAVSAALVVLPSHWFARMNTVKTYEEDRSAQMRLNSWTMAYNLAKDNLLGGGFECWELENYYKYSPQPELGHANAGGEVGSTAHSIYFEVLGTQGFGGLAIFLIALFSTLLSMRKIEKLARGQPLGNERVALARAFQASVMGYMVSGAFLSLAFFDLFWWIFAAALCFKSIVLLGQWEEAPLRARPARTPALAAGPSITATDPR